MGDALLQHIFDSTLLDTREKWLMVRQIKQGVFDEHQLETFASQLKGESTFIHRAQDDLGRAYLKKLEQWNADLDRQYHKFVVHGRHTESERQHQQDEAAADELIKEL